MIKFRDWDDAFCIGGSKASPSQRQKGQKLIGNILGLGFQFAVVTGYLSGPPKSIDTRDCTLLFIPPGGAITPK
jgi:hypothetical protein